MFSTSEPCYYKHIFWLSVFCRKQKLESQYRDVYCFNWYYKPCQSSYWAMLDYLCIMCKHKLHFHPAVVIYISNTLSSTEASVPRKRWNMEADEKHQISVERQDCNLIYIGNHQKPYLHYSFHMVLQNLSFEWLFSWHHIMCPPILQIKIASPASIS